MLNVCYDRSGGQPCKNVLSAGIFAAYCKLPSDYLTLEFTKSGYISGFKKPLLLQCTTSVILSTILTKNGFFRAEYLTKIPQSNF